jgi:hypothetical protein
MTAVKSRDKRIGLQGNVKDQAGFQKEIAMSRNNVKGHFLNLNLST